MSSVRRRVAPALTPLGQGSRDRGRRRTVTSVGCRMEILNAGSAPWPCRHSAPRRSPARSGPSIGETVGCDAPGSAVSLFGLTAPK
jgi:hypothetical protein